MNWSNDLSWSLSRLIPGYGTDHSLILLSLGKVKEGKRLSLWKFNASLLKDKEYLDDINSVIEVKKEYAACPYNQDTISQISNNEIQFVINDQLFLDTLLMKIRDRTISYATKKRKKSKETEQLLEKKIILLEQKLKLDESEREELQKANTKLISLRERKMEGVLLRSRARWIVDGEKQCFRLFSDIMGPITHGHAKGWVNFEKDGSLTIEGIRIVCSSSPGFLGRARLAHSRGLLRAILIKYAPMAQARQQSEALEKVTKYFCALEKRNYTDKQILKLHKQNGTITTDPGEILVEVNCFYERLYDYRVVEPKSLLQKKGELPLCPIQKCETLSQIITPWGHEQSCHCRLF